MKAKVFSKAILERLLSMALVLAIMCSCFALTVGATASATNDVGNDVNTQQVGSIRVVKSAYGPSFGQTVYLKPNTTYTFSYKYSTDKADAVNLRYYTSDTAGTAYTTTGLVYDTYYNMVTYTFTTVSLDTAGVITDDSKELIKSYVGITSYYYGTDPNASNPKYGQYDVVFGDFQLLEDGNGENLLADPLITSVQTAVNQTETQAIWGAMDRTASGQIAAYSYERYHLSENTYPTRDFFVLGPKDEAVKLIKVDTTGPYLVQRIWLKPATTYVFSYYYSDTKASRFIYYNPSSETMADSNVKEYDDSLWQKVYYEFTTVDVNNENATFNDDKSLVQAVIGIRNYNTIKVGSYFAKFDLHEVNDDSKTNLLMDTKFTSIGQLNNGNKWASWWAGTWTNNYYQRVTFEEKLTNDMFKRSHSVEIGTYTGGSITADKASVINGEKVVLDVTPNSDYELLEILANGKPIPCVDGKYTFTFSNYYADASTGKVSITAKFIKKDTVPSITHTTNALNKAIVQDLWLEPDTEYIFSYKYNSESASDIRAGYVKESDNTRRVDLETTKIDSNDFIYKTSSYKFTTPALTAEDVIVGSGQNEGLVKCSVGLFFSANYSASANQGDRLYGGLTCYKATDAYKTNLLINRDFSNILHDNTGMWRSYYSGVQTYMICTRYDADSTTDGVQDPSVDLFKKGDCNNNGKIDVADIVRLKKHLAYLDTEIVSVNADMNSDKTVDSFDLVHLRKLILGIYK